MIDLDHRDGRVLGQLSPLHGLEQPCLTPDEMGKDHKKTGSPQESSWSATRSLAVGPVVAHDAVSEPVGGVDVAHLNYIGGQWVPAISGATDEVVAPATGEVIGTVPSS